MLTRKDNRFSYDKKITKQAYEYFSQFDFEDVKNYIDPDKGSGLIFIMGMPRSGTTLTESVLGTAENIVAGGEKSFFSIQLHQISKDIFNPDNKLDKEFFDDLGDRYLENIKMHRNGKNFLSISYQRIFYFISLLN